MSAWEPKGKFALVTGAGSGINLAFAEQLLLAGTSVIFADVALRTEAETLLAQYPHPPTNGAASAVYHKMDQSNWKDILDTWAFALGMFGRVDLVCPGAGVWEPPYSAFWEAPGLSPLAGDDPDATLGSYKLLTINLIGPIRFAQLALDYWTAHKLPGSLIVVSSMSAYMPTIGTPLYNTSKGGLNAFVGSLAQMKQQLGIRTVSMCPATTCTPAVEQEYCAGKVRAGDMNMTAEECAQIMLRLVTAAEFGNGEMVEGMQFGTKEKTDVRMRVVPYDKLMPPIDVNGDFSGRNILLEEEKVWEKLKTTGLRPKTREHVIIVMMTC